MKLHREFSSQQDLRYGAECRRMAAYSRTSKAAAPQKPTRRRAPAFVGDWVAQLWAPPRKFAPRPIHR